MTDIVAAMLNGSKFILLRIGKLMKSGANQVLQSLTRDVLFAFATKILFS